MKKSGAALRQELKNLKWQNFLGLTLAGVINAVGVTMFLAPIGLIDSGLSGTAMFLDQMTPDWLGLSVFLIVLNFPFYIIGLKKQGIAFTVYSIYAIIIYSLASLLFQTTIPMEGGSPIAGSDILLCAVFGGLISGVGSGVTIRFGGAIDGVEVMAVTFAKYIGLTVGSFVMVYNAILYVVVGAVVQEWAIPLYSILTYAVGNKAVDYVVTGLDKAKAATIITTKKEEVSRAISNELGRGITLINAQGYYSKQEKTMLYCVINRFQIGKLKKVVSLSDPAAFVTITDIADTFGSSVKLARFKKITPDNEENMSGILAAETPPDAEIEESIIENAENINE